MSVSKQVKVETARLKAKLAVSLEAMQAIAKLEGCGKIKSIDLRWDQYNTNYSAGNPGPIGPSGHNGIFTGMIGERKAA